MANLRSKLDRAIIAYLEPIAVAVNVDVTLYPANSSAERELPLIDVMATQGPEEPPFTGNHLMATKIRLEFPAANQPNQENPNQNRLDLDAMTDAVFDALHQSTGDDYSETARLVTAAGRALAASDPTNHADMVDFTCQYVQGVSYLGGDGGNAAASSFVEMMMFQTRCCAANVG